MTQYQCVRGSSNYSIINYYKTPNSNTIWFEFQNKILQKGDEFEIFDTTQEFRVLDTPIPIIEETSWLVPAVFKMGLKNSGTECWVSNMKVRVIPMYQSQPFPGIGAVGLMGLAGAFGRGGFGKI